MATRRKHATAEQSIYRRRRQFADMEVSDVRELRSLRKENARLKKLVVDRSKILVWLVPQEGASTVGILKDV